MGAVLKLCKKGRMITDFDSAREAISICIEVEMVMAGPVVRRAALSTNNYPAYVLAR